MWQPMRDAPRREGAPIIALKSDHAYPSLGEVELIWWDDEASAWHLGGCQRYHSSEFRLWTPVPTAN